MITTYPLTLAGQTAADAVADPKNILYTASGFVVRTGADYIAPTPLTQNELDESAARQYAKLISLRNMTPAQVQTWVAANVIADASAKDAITTLAIAVSILSRRL